MIFWIQNHLIRHGRWIFITLLAVIIVAFVFTIGNTPGITTDKSNYEERVLFGFDVNNPNAINEIAGEVGLSLLLQTGSESRNERQIQNAISDRIVQRYIIDQLNIPSPSSDQLRNYIQTLAYFQNESGDFDSSKYETFLGQLESNPSASEAQFLKILAEDYQIDQLNSVIEGAGYAVDAQVQLSLDARNTEYDLFNIKVDYETYNPEIEVTDAALKDYYDQQLAAYETKEQVTASYVLFKVNTNIIAKFNDEQLDEYYAENKEAIDSKYRSSLDEATVTDETELSLDTVKDLVNSELLSELQEKGAENSANNFTYALYDQSIAYGSEAFEANKAKYLVKEIEIGSYSKDDSNRKRLPSKLLNAAFDLNAEKYYSDPIRINNGYAVLFYKGSIPAQIAAFDSVADQVKSDYLKAEKRSLFNEYGKDLKTQIEALVQSEEDFEAMIASMDAVTVEAYPNYGFNNRPSDVSPYEFQAVFRLNEGEVSDMVNFGGTGVITYLRAKKVLDYEVSDEEAEELMGNFKSFSRNTALNAFYTELMALEIAKEDEPASKSSE
jgi:peptidyl-prolyl cis-trans isomerase D